MIKGMQLTSKSDSVFSLPGIAIVIKRMRLFCLARAPLGQKAGSTGEHGSYGLQEIESQSDLSDSRCGLNSCYLAQRRSFCWQTAEYTRYRVDTCYAVGGVNSAPASPRGLLPVRGSHYYFGRGCWADAAVRLSTVSTFI